MKFFMITLQNIAVFILKMLFFRHKQKKQKTKQKSASVVVYFNVTVYV